MNAYQLISELYRLTGEVSEDLLANAQKLARDDDVQLILEAFLSMKRRDVAKRAPSSQTNNFSAPQPESQLPANRTPTSRPSLADTILDLTSRMSASQIATVFRKSGINVPFRPKDSRAKLVTRATRYIDSCPLPKRDDILSRLMDLLKVDQTQGWIGIIRGDAR